jgi:hypothetical protein
MTPLKRRVTITDDDLLYDEDGKPVCCQCPCGECCEAAVMLDHLRQPVCWDCCLYCEY